MMMAYEYAILRQISLVDQMRATIHFMPFHTRDIMTRFAVHNLSAYAI